MLDGGDGNDHLNAGRCDARHPVTLIGGAGDDHYANVGKSDVVVDDDAAKKKGKVKAKGKR
jgi:hypothetical protein